MNEIDRKTSAERCPICGKATDVAFKPFCSRRCSDIDLNRWLTGAGKGRRGRRRDASGRGRRG
jgi:endogenous inhibitor of DNA gyrase (YacG/DUF329 family)